MYRDFNRGSHCRQCTLDKWSKATGKRQKNAPFRKNHFFSSRSNVPREGVEFIVSLVSMSPFQSIVEPSLVFALMKAMVSRGRFFSFLLFAKNGVLGAVKVEKSRGFLLLSAILISLEGKRVNGDFINISTLGFVLYGRATNFFGAVFVDGHIWLSAT